MPTDLKILNYTPPRISWFQRLSRLLDILKTSPHLNSHVQTLKLDLSSPIILKSLADRNWPSLKELHFRWIPSNDEQNQVLRNLQQLVASPGLRRLSLHFAGYAWSACYFKSIITHCSPSLTDLSLLGRDIGCDIPSKDCRQLTDSSNPTPKIASLSRLLLTSAAVPVLRDLAIPLDLTQVRTLSYQGLPGPASVGPIHLICPKIKELKIVSQDPTLGVHFHLRDFRSLQTIEVQFSSYPKHDWRFFSEMDDDNQISELLITSPHHEWQCRRGFTDCPGHSLGRQLDRVVLAKFPHLKKVMFEVFDSFGTDADCPIFNRDAILKHVHQALPRLTRRNIVSVMFSPIPVPFAEPEGRRKVRDAHEAAWQPH
ncbi:hypothetical protein MIND_00552300 [Mycena indigotica]|uniref:Uncharacterized protein n=1 Tax=Mycena indigotica TaxID=2126181 RepID=A0A8H6SYM3_9AGAR|nr:uncharacterized protein MIND_00552300 [Mycena indigotica]KAF7307575.1 hypothetical protein MIND_00552300 [Mycena indigotica]